MEPISQKQVETLNYQASKQIEKRGETTSKEPVDSFSKGENLDETLKGGGGNWFTKLLDVRVPTTTKTFPAEEKKKVLEIIQPGDIILETNNAYPGWQILEKLVFNSDYTHAAIYEGNGKFIEATTGDPSGKGVVRTDLAEYLEGSIGLEIIRPPYKTPEDREAALNYARAQLGKPYDSAFNQNDDKELYCAELVQRALEAMPNPIHVPITTIKFMNRKAVGPQAFRQIGGEVVYSTGANFWKAQASHWPVYLGAATTAAIGGAVFGPLGAIGGFITGGLLSILTGNKIQAGEFSLFPKGE